MSEPAETGGSDGPRGPAGGQGEAPERAIDLEALAEKVFRLLKEQARLERERLGGRSGR